jgi:hypothetical protein
MGLSFNPNFEYISTNNSSTANLGAGATFTGVADDVRDIDVIHVVFFATQNATLFLDQSTNGTNWDLVDTFSYAANAGFSTSVAAVGQFYRVRVTNTGGSATTSFRLQSQYSSGVATTPRSLGQKTMAESFPINIASDQSTLNVNVLSTPSATPEESGFQFGTVSTAASTEVIVRRATYTEQTTNAQRSIVSSSASDSSAGTGIRTVLITYYTSTGSGPFTETITMNGTTPVNTVATNICYIEDIESVTVGSGGSAAGNIQLRAGTAGAGATIKQISTGDNQSFDAVHYVAAGITDYITGISCSHNGTTVGSGAVFRLRKQMLNTPNVPLIQVSDFVRLYGQSSTFSRIYQSPIIVTGPAKIELWVAPETTSATVYRGSFDYFTRPT